MDKLKCIYSLNNLEYNLRKVLWQLKVAERSPTISAPHLYPSFGAVLVYFYISGF